MQANGSRSKKMAKVQGAVCGQGDKKHNAAVVEIIESDDELGDDGSEAGGAAAVMQVEQIDSKATLGDFKATLFVVDQPLHALEKSGMWERNSIAEKLFQRHEDRVGVNRGSQDRRNKEAGEAAVASKEAASDEDDRVIILESDCEHHDDGDGNLKASASLDSDSEGQDEEDLDWVEVVEKKTIRTEQDDPAGDTESDDDDACSGSSSASRPRKAEGAESLVGGAKVLISAPAKARQDPNCLDGVRVLEASES